MKFTIAIVSLAAAMFVAPAIAQPGGGQGHMQTQDCSKAKDPQACASRHEQRQKMIDACKDKTGPEHSQCMQAQVQNFDCSKSADPQRCEAHKAASAECAAQTGRAHKQCVKQKLPPPDCSKAADPQRCQANQQAAGACKGMSGSQRSACMQNAGAAGK